MSIGAIGANALLSILSQPRARDAALPDWQSMLQSPADSAGQQTILPPSSAPALSFESILALQTEEAPQVSGLEELTATQKFLEEARKSPMERMREQILQQLGLTEESLAQLSPEERQAAEDKIRELIEEKLRQAMGADERPTASNASMIEVVA